MMKRIWGILILGTLPLWGSTINIAVAANVSYAMDELKRAYAHIDPKTHIRVTLGSSGKLTAQISNGAPYGLFLAANMNYPQALFASGKAIAKPVVYAQGALAYFSRKRRSYKQGITLLAQKEIRRIAIANPRTAPYGKAAVEAIRNAKLYDRVKKKLVYAESISQTVTYALTAADISLIAKSSLFSSTMKQYREGVHWATVNAALYTPIRQGMVLLQHAKDNPAYQRFYDFLLSDQGRAILAKYGYIVS